ncbi:c-type cytochrome [Oleiharenicola sp. Vm1]|uniref:c-type cytochrome n=1 Tax=Oleiharenicola sp. Vm1 TaxID=3398393 RepID=UPI0039F4E267
MRYAYYTLLFAVALTISIAGFRGMRSTQPPIIVFPDMDFQAKYKPQAASKFFADGRADRPAPAGTVPRGRSTAADPDFLRADDAHYAGKNADGSFVKGFPVEVSETMIRRGQNRFNVYCAPCHGVNGDGQGITKAYGMVATPTYHDDRLRTMAEGEIFNTITHGKNTMMPYADKLSPDERWAVIAYVRALQRAHHAKLDDVPLANRGELK